MPSSYQSLVEEISQIYESALSSGDADWNKSVLTSNWKIGERIVEVEQDSNFRAKYGEKIIHTLSQDLKRKLGTGFSSRNLRYMRQFYLVYKKQSIDPRISWSHYREIVSVEDKNDRSRLEKMVVEKAVTVRELIQIRNELFPANDSQNDVNSLYEKEIEKDKKGLRKPVLQLFTYRVDRKFSMNLAHSVPNLDLGFRVRFELGEKVGLESFKSGELVSVRKSRNSFQFEKVASVRELFTYKAYLDRVIDGDSLLVQIDLGFGVFIEQRLRLRGLDAPEIEDRDGQKAKKFVENELKGCPFLILKTYGSDIYDRYLVDVFYQKEEWKVEKIIEDGNFLNNRLLQEGLAKRL
jgi:endonuclease YncB( thermonuclease family)